MPLDVVTTARGRVTERSRASTIAAAYCRRADQPRGIVDGRRRNRMRRSLLAAMSAICLAGALAVGPFGAAAAAPYVYGCTPALLFVPSSSYEVDLWLYNGSASTASLTIKVLARSGAILNSTLSPVPPPVTSTLVATNTAIYGWNAPVAVFPTSPTDSTLPASVRIVSSVPISATLNHGTNFTDARIVTCTPQQP
jgi:hypothetical protein